ncbi:hypothetical protein [Sinomicrobium sp. M5D2P9]
MRKQSFHVKHLCQPLYLLGLVVFIQGCIPVRLAPRISEYQVDRGVDIDKRIKTKKNLFVFDNPKKRIHFVKFLEGKYKLEAYGNEERFKVNLNESDFDFFVFAPQLNDSYLDFTGLTDDDDSDVANNEDDSFHYIAIRVSTVYEDDCLSMNSLHYNIVLNYLKELKAEYLSSL